MKYCKVVHDIALSHRDWLCYDKQFCYLRQSAPDEYPWDQIHWELWLGASANFWRSQPITNKPQRSPISSKGQHAAFLCEFFSHGECAKGVSLSMFAINVQQSTQQFTAPYKVLNSNLMELNLKETLLKYKALYSLPVTPIRMEWLECLLHCYEQNNNISFSMVSLVAFMSILLVIGFLLNLLTL